MNDIPFQDTDLDDDTMLASNVKSTPEYDRPEIPLSQVSAPSEPITGFDDAAEEPPAIGQESSEPFEDTLAQEPSNPSIPMFMTEEAQKWWDENKGAFGATPMALPQSPAGNGPVGFDVDAVDGEDMSMFGQSGIEPSGDGSVVEQDSGFPAPVQQNGLPATQFMSEDGTKMWADGDEERETHKQIYDSVVDDLYYLNKNREDIEQGGDITRENLDFIAKVFNDVNDYDQKSGAYRSSGFSAEDKMGLVDTIHEAARKARKNASLGKSVVHALVSGTMRYCVSSMLKAGSWLLGAVGNNEAEDSLLRTTDEMDKGIERDFNAGITDVRDVHSVWDAVKYAVRTGVEQTPQLLMTIAAGAAGKGIGALGAAARGLSGAKKASFITSSIRAAQFGMNWTQSLGEAVGDQRDEGLPTNYTLAALQATGYAALDSLFGGRTKVARDIVGRSIGMKAAEELIERLKKQFVPTALAAVRKALGEAIMEGATEDLQSQVIGRARRYLQTGSAFRKGEDISEAGWEALNEFLGGFFGTIGGGAYSQYQNRQMSKRVVDGSTKLAEAYGAYNVLNSGDPWNIVAFAHAVNLQRQALEQSNYAKFGTAETDDGGVRELNDTERRKAVVQKDNYVELRNAWLRSIPQSARTDLALFDNSNYDSATISQEALDSVSEDKLFDESCLDNAVAENGVYRAIDPKTGIAITIDDNLGHISIDNTKFPRSPGLKTDIAFDVNDGNDRAAKLQDMVKAAKTISRYNEVHGTQFKNLSTNIGAIKQRLEGIYGHKMPTVVVFDGVTGTNVDEVQRIYREKTGQDMDENTYSALLGNRTYGGYHSESGVVFINAAVVNNPVAITATLMHEDVHAMWDALAKQLAGTNDVHSRAYKVARIQLLSGMDESEANAIDDKNLDSVIASLIDQKNGSVGSEEGMARLRESLVIRGEAPNPVRVAIRKLFGLTTNIDATDAEIDRLAMIISENRGGQVGNVIDWDGTGTSAAQSINDRALDALADAMEQNRKDVYMWANRAAFDAQRRVHTLWDMYSALDAANYNIPLATAILMRMTQDQNEPGKRPKGKMGLGDREKSMADAQKAKDWIREKFDGQESMLTALETDRSGIEIAGKFAEEIEKQESAAAENAETQGQPATGTTPETASSAPAEQPSSDMSAKAQEAEAKAQATKDIVVQNKRQKRQKKQKQSAPAATEESATPAPAEAPAQEQPEQSVPAADATTTEGSSEETPAPSTAEPSSSEPVAPVAQEESSSATSTTPSTTTESVASEESTVPEATPTTETSEAKPLTLKEKIEKGLHLTPDEVSMAKTLFGITTTDLKREYGYVQNKEDKSWDKPVAKEPAKKAENKPARNASKGLKFGPGAFEDAQNFYDDIRKRVENGETIPADEMEQDVAALDVEESAIVKDLGLVKMQDGSYMSETKLGELAEANAKAGKDITKAEMKAMSKFTGKSVRDLKKEYGLYARKDGSYSKTKDTNESAVLRDEQAEALRNGLDSGLKQLVSEGKDIPAKQYNAAHDAGLFGDIDDFRAKYGKLYEVLSNGDLHFVGEKPDAGKQENPFAKEFKKQESGNEENGSRKQEEQPKQESLLEKKRAAWKDYADKNNFKANRAYIDPATGDIYLVEDVKEDVEEVASEAQALDAVSREGVVARDLHSKNERVIRLNADGTIKTRGVSYISLLKNKKVEPIPLSDERVGGNILPDKVKVATTGYSDALRNAWNSRGYDVNATHRHVSMRVENMNVEPGSEEEMAMEKSARLQKTTKPVAFNVPNILKSIDEKSVTRAKMSIKPNATDAQKTKAAYAAFMKYAFDGKGLDSTDATDKRFERMVNKDVADFLGEKEYDIEDGETPMTALKNSENNALISEWRGSYRRLYLGKLLTLYGLNADSGKRFAQDFAGIIRFGDADADSVTRNEDGDVVNVSDRRKDMLVHLAAAYDYMMKHEFGSDGTYDSMKGRGNAMLFKMVGEKTSSSDSDSVVQSDTDPEVRSDKAFERYSKYNSGFERQGNARRSMSVALGNGTRSSGSEEESRESFFGNNLGQVASETAKKKRKNAVGGGVESKNALAKKVNEIALEAKRNNGFLTDRNVEDLRDVLTDAYSTDKTIDDALSLLLRGKREDVVGDALAKKVNEIALEAKRNNGFLTDRNVEDLRDVLTDAYSTDKTIDDALSLLLRGKREDVVGDALATLNIDIRDENNLNEKPRLEGIRDALLSWERYNVPDYSKRRHVVKVKTGRVASSEILKMADDMTLRSGQRDTLKRVLDCCDKLGVVYSIHNKSRIDYSGVEDSGFVSFPASFLRDGYIYDTAKIDTVIHELTHGATDYAITFVESALDELAYGNTKDWSRYKTSMRKADSIMNEELYNAVVDLKSVYDQIKDRDVFKDVYAVESVHELVAESNNPGVREELRRLSLWERFSNALKRIVFSIFGINETSTRNQGVVSRNADQKLQEIFDAFIDNPNVAVFNLNRRTRVKENDFSKKTFSNSNNGSVSVVPNSAKSNISSVDSDGLPNSSNPSMAYKFIGVEGAARLGLYPTAAEAMEKAGRTRKYIYDKTKWFRGKDGKWRRELPGIKVKPGFEGKMFLGDMIDAPLLLKAYPELDSFVVYDVPEEYKRRGVAGAYRHGEEAIYAETGKGDINFADAIAHEIQHFIQHKEGFATGTTVQMSGGRFDDVYFNSPGEVEARSAAARTVMENIDTYTGVPTQKTADDVTEETLTQDVEGTVPTGRRTYLPEGKKGLRRNLRENAPKGRQKQAGGNTMQFKLVEPTSAKFLNDTEKTYWAANSTNGNLLDELSKDENVRVRFTVAENPHVNEKTLMLLANDEKDKVRQFVAENTSASTDVLSVLAKDENWSIRRAVASNPNTPSELLSRLAEDDNQGVRISVVYNKNTPPEALSLLAKDVDRSIRSTVAGRLNAPRDVLSRLASDDDANVRGNIAENPNTPREALSRLAEDVDSSVRRSVARNKNTSSEALSRLAEDKDEDVRRFVAGNQNTPSDVIRKFANSNDSWEREAVAMNKNAPEDILVALLDDSDDVVALAALNNPNLPGDVYDFEMDKIGEQNSPGLRNLVAVHNAKASDIITALRKGGFAAPSIAIQKVDTAGTQGYGDGVSVFFKEDTVATEKDSRNVIYTDDGWTPTIKPQADITNVKLEDIVDDKFNTKAGKYSNYYDDNKKYVGRYESLAEARRYKHELQGRLYEGREFFESNPERVVSTREIAAIIAPDESKFDELASVARSSLVPMYRYNPESETVSSVAKRVADENPGMLFKLVKNASGPEGSGRNAMMFKGFQPHGAHSPYIGGGDADSRLQGTKKSMEKIRRAVGVVEKIRTRSITDRTMDMRAKRFVESNRDGGAQILRMVREGGHMDALQTNIALRYLKQNMDDFGSAQMRIADSARNGDEAGMKLAEAEADALMSHIDSITEAISRDNSEAGRRLRACRTLLRDSWTYPDMVRRVLNVTKNGKVSVDTERKLVDLSRRMQENSDAIEDARRRAAGKPPVDRTAQTDVDGQDEGEATVDGTVDRIVRTSGDRRTHDENGRRIMRELPANATEDEKTLHDLVMYETKEAVLQRIEDGVENDTSEQILEDTLDRVNTTLEAVGDRAITMDELKQSLVWRPLSSTDTDSLVTDKEWAAKGRAVVKRITEIRNALNEAGDGALARPNAENVPGQVQTLRRELRAILDAFSEGDETHRRMQERYNELSRLAEAQPDNADVKRQMDELLVQMKERQDELLDDPSTPEYQNYVKKVVDSLKADIAETQRKIDERDFSEFTEEETRKADRDPQVLELKEERRRLKKEFFDLARREGAANMTPMQKGFSGVKNFIDFSRTMRTSADLSATWRQGALFLSSHPLQAAKVFAKSLKAFSSERKADMLWSEMGTAEERDEMRRMGLGIQDPNEEGSQDDAYNVNRANKLYQKVMGFSVGGFQPFAGSERAYKTSLNYMRAFLYRNMCDNLAKSMEGTGVELTTRQKMDIAQAVNIATGSGVIPKQAGSGLNYVFWAPKLMASRFEYLTGLDMLLAKDKDARKTIAKEKARALIGMAVIVAVAKAMAKSLGGDDDEEDDETLGFGPIQDRNWAYVKIGDSKVDLTGGLASYLTFFSREIPLIETKKYTTKGEVSKMGGREKWDEIGRFIRKKANPVLGMAFDIVTGQNVVGEKVNPYKALTIDTVMPLAFTDLYESGNDNESLSAGLVVGLLSLLGAGGQTYASGNRTLMRKVGVYKDAVQALTKADDPWSKREIEMQIERDFPGYGRKDYTYTTTTGKVRKCNLYEKAIRLYNDAWKRQSEEKSRESREELRKAQDLLREVFGRVNG